jgi:hypothetical protein
VHTKNTKFENKNKHKYCLFIYLQNLLNLFINYKKVDTANMEQQNILIKRNDEEYMNELPIEAF